MTAAKEKALSLVGQGYLYGAKGQICSQAFREQQAAQYPEQADSILKTGAKWDGLPVWDCAQLTRAAAKAAQVTLVSGATSQWNQDVWVRKGTIDSIPPDEVCFVFRQADGRMQHTGIALGDDTCVHARGTAYGVIRQEMTGYAWTHWASPWGKEPEVLWTGRVQAQSGSTVNVRCTPGGRVTARLPVGTEVAVCAVSAGWCAIRYEGGSGYMQSAFIRDITPEKQLLQLRERLDQIENRLAKAGL